MIERHVFLLVRGRHASYSNANPGQWATGTFGICSNRVKNITTRLARTYHYTKDAPIPRVAQMAVSKKAKSLGLEVPATLLARADEVIE
jgi:hypothetical protein